MKTIAQSDLIAIKNGSTEPLSRLFQENYSYCVKQLCLQTQCMPEDAKDLVMDAIIVLREKIMMEAFVNENTQGYLITIAKNMLKNKLKRDRRQLEFEPGLVEGYLAKKTNSPILTEDSESKIEIILLALRKLGGKCEILLNRNLVDRVPLRNLSDELGYSSEDVVKTTKARCMKKLKSLIKELMNP